MALIVLHGNLQCGGTLVASKYVISAAHCMFSDQALTRPLRTRDFKVLNHLRFIYRERAVKLISDI